MEYFDLYGEMALRLFLALSAGIILGLNRWMHHKSAGIRTHSLVALGSATAVMSIGHLERQMYKPLATSCRASLLGLDS